MWHFVLRGGNWGSIGDYWEVGSIAIYTLDRSLYLTSSAPELGDPNSQDWGAVGPPNTSSSPRELLSISP